jgi:hypothetical protein
LSKFKIIKQLVEGISKTELGYLDSLKPEKGGSIFLLNIDELVPDCMASQSLNIFQKY